jgi:hypothetical protein
MPWPKEALTLCNYWDIDELVVIGGRLGAYILGRIE